MIREEKATRTVTEEYASAKYYVCDKCGVEKQFHQASDAISTSWGNSDWVFMILHTPRVPPKNGCYVPGLRDESNRHYCPNCWEKIKELL